MKVCHFLSKKKWSPLNIPQSLVTTIFQEKYFNDGIVMEAKAVSSSFTWRSLLSAREFLKIGVTWKMRNGARIKFEEISGCLGQPPFKFSPLR